MGLAGRVLGVDDTSFLRSIDVQLVFLVSMVSSMGSVASPALPAMSGTLGVPEARIGLVFTAFTLPAIFALPLVGVVADLYGRKAVVVPGLVLFGAAGLGVGLTGDFRVILGLRGLQGIGYTAFNSLTVALLGDLLTGSQESAAQGSRVLLNKLAGFAGPTIAGVLAAIAWQYPFYLYAVAIPAGVLVYLRLGDDVHDSEDDDRGLREYAADIRQLIGDPFVVGVLGGGFVRMFLKYALYTFLALAIVNQYGGSIGYAGLLVGLYSLVGAVVASQSARFTEGLTHSYALLLGFVIAALAYVAFPLVGGLVGVTALVLIHGVGEGIINPVHKSILSQSVEADVRGGFVTTNAIVQNVAKTITPVALSPILLLVGENAYDDLFLVAGVVSLLACVLALIALVVGEPSPPRKLLQRAGTG
ncbi:MAG: MFS transporter [Haloferacaceae archaeon]